MHCPMCFEPLSIEPDELTCSCGYAMPRIRVDAAELAGAELLSEPRPILITIERLELHFTAPRAGQKGPCVRRVF